MSRGGGGGQGQSARTFLGVAGASSSELKGEEAGHLQVAGVGRAGRTEQSQEWGMLSKQW